MSDDERGWQTEDDERDGEFIEGEQSDTPERLDDDLGADRAFDGPIEGDETDGTDETVGATHDASGIGFDDPFSELEATETDGIEPSEGAIEELFDPVETPELDDEAVWEAVLSGNGDEPIGTEPTGTGADAVVPKNKYCKQCEFFSKPPDVSCSNPGTEIVEVVGIDRFRVTDCPVVERRGRAKAVFPEEE